MFDDGTKSETNLRARAASVPAVGMQASKLVRLAISQVAGFLIGINMPDHIVRQADNLVASTLRHASKSLSFGLIFESVCGEINSYYDDQPDCFGHTTLSCTYLTGGRRP